jgi:uncharacterized protein HemX
MESIPEAVAKNELLPGLQAVRDQIAADLEACAAMRDRAALYARLVDVLARIDELAPAIPKGDTVDEIARRRADRRASAAKGAPRAKSQAK